MCRCYGDLFPLIIIIAFRPDVTFFCDLDFDPFLFMQDNEKVYGAYKKWFLSEL
jgi:hypothetical protein